MEWAEELQQRGLTLQQIADEIGRQFGQQVTKQAVGQRLRRVQAARDVEPYAVEAERRVLPWRVKNEHRTTPVGKTVHMMVRQWKGVPLGRDEQRQVERFRQALADLPGGDWVVTYKSSRMGGFRLRPRRRTDELIAGVIAAEA